MKKDNSKKKIFTKVFATLAGISLVYSFLNNPYARKVNKIMEKEFTRIEKQIEKEKRMNPITAKIFYEGQVPKYVELGNNIYSVKGVYGAKTDLGIIPEEVKRYYNWDRLKNLARDLNNNNPVVREDRKRYTLEFKTGYEENSPQLKGLEIKTESLTD